MEQTFRIAHENRCSPNLERYSDGKIRHEGIGPLRALEEHSKISTATAGHDHSKTTPRHSKRTPSELQFQSMILNQLVRTPHTRAPCRPIKGTKRDASSALRDEQLPTATAGLHFAPSTRTGLLWGMKLNPKLTNQFPPVSSWNSVLGN